MSNDDKVAIAVFDFDGTSIYGSSPVALVRSLMGKRQFKFNALIRLLLWGALYKLHLPQKEAWARSLVFTSFEGSPKEETDQLLMDFYDSKLEGGARFKPIAHSTMSEYRNMGVKVAVVSATFEPIVRRAMEFHPIDVHICTEMAVDDNNRYTRHVKGDCIEGEAKCRAINNRFDELYGSGKWYVLAAYGDHSSDRGMLSLAKHGFAVDPDLILKIRSKRRGWKVLDWSKDASSDKAVHDSVVVPDSCCS